MAGFDTKYTNQFGEYEVKFYTRNREDAVLVENLCRLLIGHAKEGEYVTIYRQMLHAFSLCEERKENNAE